MHVERPLALRAILLALAAGTDAFAFVLVGTIWNAAVKAGWFAVTGVAAASVAYFRDRERNA